MGIPKQQWANNTRPSDNDSPDNIDRCTACKFKDCKFESISACIKSENKTKEMIENAKQGTA